MPAPAFDFQAATGNFVGSNPVMQKAILAGAREHGLRLGVQAPGVDLDQTLTASGPGMHI